MKRNEFIKQCGFVCLGAMGISTITQSCSAVRQLNASIVADKLVVPLSAFNLKINPSINLATAEYLAKQFVDSLNG